MVGSYDKAMVVGDGKLKTTDGVYGIRFAHNTEASVKGFSDDGTVIAGRAALYVRPTAAVHTKGGIPQRGPALFVLLKPGGLVGLQRIREVVSACSTSLRDVATFMRICGAAGA